VKLWKLLSVPVAIVAAGLFATPALANVATFKNVMINCVQAGNVCVQSEVKTAAFDADKHVTVTLLGHKQGATDDKFMKLATSDKVVVKKGETEFKFCFQNVTTAGFDKFKVVIESADNDLKVAKGESEEQKNDCPVVTQTTSPAQTVASASAARTAVLASTGGFDFRFPLIAAALLVVGVSLLLVSVSRGRSASK
jgi:hypothetical protein